MFVWLEAPLRTSLFTGAPAAADVWIGEVRAIGAGREIVPLRFAGLDFWIMFLSPYVECNDDDVLVRQMLALADVTDFVPSVQSRLIKFCRASAESHHFTPADWPLPRPEQVFQFAQSLGDVMRLYTASVPDIKQYLYLPASDRLSKLYGRAFKGLSNALDETMMLTITRRGGALHVVERTRIS